MDGVICHTNPYHSMAFEQFFKKRNMHPKEEEYQKHMYGKSNSYIFSHFFGRKIAGEELLEMEREKEELFRELYKSEVKEIDGFLEFLQELKSLGIKTAVATSAPRANLYLIIDTLGIRESMDSLMASEDVVVHKPNPEIYLKAAENLEVSTAECLVFEDSFSGITAGLEANMKVVGVLSSHTEEELPPCELYIKTFKGIDLNQLRGFFI